MASSEDNSNTTISNILEDNSMSIINFADQIDNNITDNVTVASKTAAVAATTAIDLATTLTANVITPKISTTTPTSAGNNTLTSLLDGIHKVASMNAVSSIVNENDNDDIIGGGSSGISGIGVLMHGGGKLDNSNTIVASSIASITDDKLSSDHLTSSLLIAKSSNTAVAVTAAAAPVVDGGEKLLDLDDFETTTNTTIITNGGKNIEIPKDDNSDIELVDNNEDDNDRRLTRLFENRALSIDRAHHKRLLSNDDIVERSLGNMFSDVFDNKSGEALEEETLEESCQFSDGPEKNCMICKGSLNSPRILSCLHVFCETCLDNLLIDETGDTSKNDCVIMCPTCEQTTKVGPKGAASLTCDYIFTNIFDLSTIEPKMLACTSCKNKENAISRCNDCANFLCAGCDSAHKYMRCFENHEVVKLEDLQNSNEKLTIHKPLFCAVHTSENLKYYCFNCQIPVCNDCLIADHKGSEHHYDLLSAAEKCVRGDVTNLIKEARSKVQYCNSAAQDLSTSLTELQAQHDTARDLIEESHRTFTSIIDECREKSLKDLEKLHSERELKIMDLLHVVEKTTEKIDGVCKFTNRVLDQANAGEFLSMKKLIHAQFINLISNIPKCDVSYSLEFDTKFEKFEQLAHDTFGKFRTESTPPSPKESTPPPTLPGMPPQLINHHNLRQQQQHQQQNGVGGIMIGNTQSALTNNGSSVTASSPISLPTSMQSSFDGDLSALGTNFILPTNVLQTPDSPPQQQQQQQQPHQQQQQQMHNLNNHNHQQIHHHPGLHNTNLQQHQMNNGMNHQMQQQHHLLNGIGGTGNLNNINNANTVVPSGVGNAINGNGASNTGTNIGGFNSIAEYNLQRLANIAEATPDLNDTSGAIGGTTGASSVPANQHITLADILAGNERALTNFHALAKLGLNSNGEFAVDDFNTDMTVNHHHHNNHNLLNGVVGNNGARGSSPGIDSLLSDFALGVGGASTSPMPSLSVLGGSNTGSVVGGGGNGTGGATDELGIANFSSAPGRTKATPMQIRCKFGSLGTSKAQFNSPHGFCLGVDEEIIVADTNNHRIEVFEKNGAFKFQFGVPGKEEGQLWYPRKVAVMLTNGKFVVCDRGNERSRMQIFSKNGHFMKKIAIRYIDIVAGLAVTSKGQIVAVDSVSPTVFIISEDGDLVHWFDCSDYMREPSDIAIRDNDFYVCDFKGHCVAVFKDDGSFQYRIGNEKVTCFPNGIDISNAGDILIGDSHGNRFHVACYSRDGILQSEFECPHVKVSRCCGLKITSEGYVVTLAKNNHHVLVLNTLYVQ